jgi:hypothetical protein
MALEFRPVYAATTRDALIFTSFLRDRLHTSRMAIFNIVACVYLFIMVNALAIEAFDLWLDAAGTPERTPIAPEQAGGPETAFQ